LVDGHDVELRNAEVGQETPGPLAGEELAEVVEDSVAKDLPVVVAAVNG